MEEGGVRANLELCESGGGRPGLPIPNSHYGLCGLCGRKAKLEEEEGGGGEDEEEEG